jgi:hypothetical protein
MIVRSFSLCLGGAALLLAGLVTRISAQSPACTAPSAPAAQAARTATYPVADLVIPVPAAAPAEPEGQAVSVGWEACPVPSPATLEVQLMNKIQRLIAPGTWDRIGTMDYHPLTMSLIVNHTPAVQRQVAALLADLRRLQDTEVAFEVRLVTLPVPTFQRVTKQLNLDLRRGQAQLDDGLVRRFLESCQKNPACSVTQTPKLTLLNGQCSCMRLTDKEASVVKAERPFGEPGLQVALQPLVSVDRRSIDVRLRVRKTSIIRKANFPLMTSQAVERYFKVRDGGTTLLPGWTTGDAGAPQCVAILVTPRIVVQKEEEVRQTGCSAGAACPTPLKTVVKGCAIKAAHNEEQASGCCEGKCAWPNDPKVIELVAQYRRACIKGDSAAAMRLAVQALALDPTCFCKDGCGKGK